MARASDGMDLHRFEAFDVATPDRLPDDSAIRAKVDQVIADLDQLRTAPVVDPYSGPAILEGRTITFDFTPGDYFPKSKGLNRKFVAVAWPVFVGGQGGPFGAVVVGTPKTALTHQWLALLGLLEVVLGPLWAWLGAGETPASATLAGGAVVLAALVLNELGSLQRRNAA